MRVLVTNDDGVNSPFLEWSCALARRLSDDVFVVVPAEEQSWKGKSMTRFSSITAKSRTIGGCPGWMVSGTPADCAHVALAHLSDQPVDLVISGVNVGTNIGIGYLLSSGTVGAGFEANLLGVKALAISQALPRERFKEYSDTRSLPPPFVHDLRNQAMPALEQVLHGVKQWVASAAPEPLTWSLNLPLQFSAPGACAITHLSRSTYERCHRREGDSFHRILATMREDLTPGGDLAALRAGVASLTILSPWKLGQELHSEVEPFLPALKGAQ